jgi:hypothetical protein
MGDPSQIRAERRVGLSFYARRAMWERLIGRQWVALRELSDAHEAWVSGLVQLADWGFRLELDEPGRRLRISPREAPRPSQSGPSLEVVAQVRDLAATDELDPPEPQVLGLGPEDDDAEYEDAAPAIDEEVPDVRTLRREPDARASDSRPARGPAPPDGDARRGGDRRRDSLPFPAPARAPRTPVPVRADRPGPGAPREDAPPEAGTPEPVDLPELADGGLRIGDAVLPVSHVTDTCGIVAVKGSGKSYAAMVVAEEMLERDLPFAVLDPTGAWWGLRAAGAGHRGYPIPVLGGDHGDLALDAEMGGAVARYLVEHYPAQLLVDMSLLTPDEQQHFAADFAQTLFHENRRAMHVFVDEADEFMPQVPTQPAERASLRAFDRLVRRGRIRGIGITVITQRSAVIAKNVLTQVGKLLVLRTAGPQDVDAVERWVRRVLDGDSCRRLLASLGRLGLGEAWLIEPGRTPVARKIRVRERLTYDSSRTPGVDDDVVDPDVVDADVDALEDVLAAARADRGAPHGRAVLPGGRP